VQLAISYAQKLTFLQPYLIDLYNSTPDKKDGVSMADLFEAIIDFAERKYGCRVAGLGTDDDSGSKAGWDIMENVGPGFSHSHHHVVVIM